MPWSKRRENLAREAKPREETNGGEGERRKERGESDVLPPASPKVEG